MAQVRTRKRNKSNVTLHPIWPTLSPNLTVRQIRRQKPNQIVPPLLKRPGVAAYNDYLHGNIGITSEKITLKDFMTAWLDNVVSTNVKPLSLQKYCSHFKNQIAPYLGNVTVQDLTPAMVDEWMRKLSQSALSKKTLAVTHALIHNALNYAVYPAQLISSNPVAYIKVPKNAPQNVIERHIISPERFAALLEKYPFGSPFYIPLLLLYHTGMRLGEVLGLSWSDVDFATKRITVRQQMTYRNRLGCFLTTPKTKSSNRYIIVDDFLLRELKRWQVRQLENEQAYGGSYVYVYREADAPKENRRTRSTRAERFAVD